MSVKLNKSQAALMVAIVAATLGEAQFMYVSTADAKPLVAAGYAEQNAEMVNTADAKQLATRATDSGIAAFPLESPAAGAVVDSNLAANGNEIDNSANNAPSASDQPKRYGFAIVEMEIPATKRGRSEGGDPYPFDDLQLKQSFFVPATAKRPEPAKSLGSTVTTANERYAVEVPGQTRINRKGREVPVTEQTRRFEIRSIPDGAAWGHPGVAGAGIWRTL